MADQIDETTEGTPSDSPDIKFSQKQLTDNEEEINITSADFIDPETLIEKLATVQLTEKDTEELLHEAYKVNNKLKEMLRRQEQGHDIQMRKIRTAGELSGRSSHNLNSNKSPLPPISSHVPDNNRNIYTSYQSTRNTQQHSSSRIKSSQGRQSSSTRNGSAGQSKPEWNSRFSYS